VPELVSVLIPAFNAERWLGAAIQSALDQTWPRKEVIVVDDGSRDGTLQVARSFVSSGVRVVTQRNAGASAARNRALSLAQGDYIQWLDADDLLAPDKIEQQLRGAKPGATSTSLLSSAYAEFYATPERARRVPTALWQDLAPVDFLLARFRGNLWMSPAVWLVSRRLTQLAGPWDERLTLDDDGEYFSRVAAASRHIHFEGRACSYYRRGNVHSLSRGTSERACESLLLSLRLCIAHLRSLEDSVRTRSAGVQLLQSWTDLSDCFGPDHPDRLRRVSELARELGGTLRPPQLGWKYAPIRTLFGWKAARRARTAVSNIKLRARLQLDRLPQLPRVG
jgi:glycosyltransferase involved in cell wall biosynthesis